MALAPSAFAMKHCALLCLVFLGLLLPNVGRSQAQWVGSEKPIAPGVFLFRTTWEEDQMPNSLPVRVAADNRYRLFLNRAAAEAGLGNQYLSLLAPWRRQMGRGLTTWAEEPPPSRSDCHAWGSSPNIEAYRTLLGVSSAAPGFQQVRIRPHLNGQKQLSGEIPHPQGLLKVRYEQESPQGLKAEIFFPGQVRGLFYYQGAQKALKPGWNRFKLGK